MTRPKTWSQEVEEAYRFQLAGYRDEKEYRILRQTDVGLLDRITYNLFLNLLCFRL